MKTAIEILIERVEWKETHTTGDGSLPHATHEGVLEFCGAKLRVYRLNTGEAIINADDFNDFLLKL